MLRDVAVTARRARLQAPASEFPRRTGTTLLAIWAAALLFVVAELSLPEASEVPLVILTTLLASAFVLRRDRQAASEIETLAQARRGLVEEVLDVEERERRRLAQAVHDGPLQLLAFSSQELAEAEAGDLSALGSARGALSEAVNQTRTLMQELTPAAFGRGALEPTLRVICDVAARRAGLSFELEVEEAATGRQDELLAALVRELVANVAKHARASHLGVSVRRRGEEIEAVVCDDGAGIPPGAIARAERGGHLGLASIRQRVDAVCGTLALESTPGGGTRAVVRLPALALV